MDRAGEKLKRVRERLKLTFRDVEEASQKIAARRSSEEFAIALSRLSDIENKGTVPTIYRLYSLCAIYRLDVNEVLRWYGVPLDQLPSESLQIGLEETHAVHFSAPQSVTVPQPVSADIDLSKTTFLSYLVKRWGRMPLSLLNGLDLRPYRYGFIGLEDWSMYPILRPGALVLIDESRRKIAAGGWANEFDRPIYFFEHRGGYICGWCTLQGQQLLIQSHPASQQQASFFQYPAEIDLIGEVVGVAMPIEPRKRRHARLPVASAKPSNT
ncbi:MAG TPA: helix-turn-helix transcriptional regulator [Bryobacteraceae bacterium]|nr:helix-turn-helix transcriptional regulator [Bryobacteraceae bacterium]